jgi:CDP-glycerol glycerophosphotransferase
MREYQTLLKCLFRKLALLGRTPKVSVIVPVYNVEQYLPACLGSILAQSHSNLEIICVDDGSPDNSIEVLRTFAAADPRVNIVRKVNNGLGAARNTGIEHSTGRIIFFVDSDDTIPPRAVEHLLTCLKRSGSDFVVGSIMRDTPSGRHIPLWAKKLHATTRIRLSLADEPDVLKNVFAWTKMFHKKFFLSVVGGFPDGIYEDQVPSAKAYIHGTFDIIKEIVYYYRIRDDSSSITQQKASMSDLTARWKTIHDVSDCMAQAAIHVQRAWEAKAVGFDMRPYYEQTPRTAPDYWEFLQYRVRSFVDTAGYNLFRRVPVADRLIAAATYHGYRDDVKELLCRRESQTWKVPGAVVDGTPQVADEFFKGLRLRPDGVVETLEATGDITIAQHVDSVRIEGDELVVRGSAYLTNLSQSFENSTLRLIARPISARDDSHDVLPVRVTRHHEPDADLRAGDPWNDHAASGFEAVFCLSDMRKGHWNLSVVLEVDGVCRSAPLAAPDPTTAGRLPSFSALTDQGRWYLVLNRDTHGLQLRRSVAAQFAVHKIFAGDGFLRVELGGSAPATNGRFVALSSDKKRVVGTVSTGNQRTVVQFTIPPTSRFKSEWTLCWQCGRRRTKLAWGRGSRSFSCQDARPYLIGRSPAGNLVVHTAPLLGEVDAASLSADGLVVKGWIWRDLSVTNDITARLWHRLSPGRSIPVRVPNGPFTLTLPFTSNTGQDPSRTHSYTAVLEAPGYEQFWLRVSDELLTSTPIKDSCGGLAATLTATPGKRALCVRLRNALADEAQSRRSQHLLQAAYRCDHRPIDAVLFESMNGKSVGDSPLALSRALHRRRSGLIQYWSVESLSIPAPEWATPLLRYSSQWYKVLASARLLVNNNNWPWFFTKRVYQTYLQTWHGTPLKKIGHDVPKSNLSLSYLSLMAREAAAWDILIAQNDYSSKIFAQAFGYEGDILQIGYPRNDALLDETAAETRKTVRAALGLADDIMVVLYAPTWRDNLKAATGYGRVSFLDFNELQARTTRNCVVLYRGHPNTADNTGSLHETVIDMTRYPDLNHLMLASDCLVTDYSSIFFDYVIMRKPVYFLVPDLKQYRDHTRGFYVPLETIAPGPLCADTSALADHINNGFTPQYIDKSEKFRAAFAAKDDGFAAMRLAEYIDVFFQSQH